MFSRYICVSVCARDNITGTQFSISNDDTAISMSFHSAVGYECITGVDVFGVLIPCSRRQIHKTNDVTQIATIMFDPIDFVFRQYADGRLGFDGLRFDAGRRIHVGRCIDAGCGVHAGRICDAGRCVNRNVLVTFNVNIFWRLPGKSLRRR